MHRAQNSEVSDIPSPIRNNTRPAAFRFGGVGKRGVGKLFEFSVPLKPCFAITATTAWPADVVVGCPKKNCQTTPFTPVSRLRGGVGTRKLRTPLLSNLANLGRLSFRGTFSYRVVLAPRNLCVCVFQALRPSSGRKVLPYEHESGRRSDHHGGLDTCHCLLASGGTEYCAIPTDRNLYILVLQTPRYYNSS